MVTAEELLKQSKKNKKFIPDKRRSWDYLNDENNHTQDDLNRTQPNLNRTQNHTQDDLNRTQPSLNRTQIREGNHTQNSLKFLLENTGGLQEKILFFIYVECKKNKAKFTKKISKKSISYSLNIKFKSINNTMQRLVNKKLLMRKKVICGRDGATAYELPDFVRKYFSRKSYTNPVFHIRDNISSSKNINKTTITDLAENWKKINIAPLEKIGFSGSQLKQLQSLNTPDVVQESIYHFAYGLKYNAKAKTYDAPLNVLMGVLRKGEAWVESQYEPAQMIAQRDLLARKQAEREKLKALHDQAYDLAFETWQSGLSDAEKTQHIDAMTKPPRDIRPQSVRLSCYFRERVWSTVQQDYLIAPSDSE